MAKIIFLGTSDAVPTAERNHSSIWLEYNGENILIDCGEGTQRQIRKAGLNPCKINKILITHWHGDHVLGLSGLFQTLNFSGCNNPISIYGPKGTKQYVNELFRTFAFQGKFPIEIKEVEGKFFESKDFFLEAEQMAHGTPCNAYSFVKKAQTRIDKSKLKKTPLEGQIISKLKEGKDITFNGKKYLAKNLTYKEEGKKISFVLDTALNSRIIPFVKNANLLICESTFSEDMEEKAREYKHLTVKQAAEIAKKSRSKKLILTHISQRYSKNPKKILEAAKKTFKNSFLAEDLDVIEVK